jgi:hypothetical protein
MFSTDTASPNGDVDEGPHRAEGIGMLPTAVRRSAVWSSLLKTP